MSGRAGLSGQREGRGPRQPRQWNGLVKKRKKGWEMVKGRQCLIFPSHSPYAARAEYFPSFLLMFLGSKAGNKSNPCSWNWQVFVSWPVGNIFPPSNEGCDWGQCAGDGWRRALGCLSPSRPSATRVLLGLWSVIVAFPARRWNNPHCAGRRLPLPSSEVWGEIKKKPPPPVPPHNSHTKKSLLFHLILDF